MVINDHRALVKLFHIAYLIAQIGHAFSNFKDMVELEKLNRVEFQLDSYKNETACRNFVNSIAEYLFINLQYTVTIWNMSLIKWYFCHLLLLKEDYEWLWFIWGFSHQLELALKDSLKVFIKSVGDFFAGLIIYTKSHPKNRELKNRY